MPWWPRHKDAEGARCRCGREDNESGAIAAGGIVDPGGELGTNRAGDAQERDGNAPDLADIPAAEIGCPDQLLERHLAAETEAPAKEEKVQQEAACRV